MGVNGSSPFMSKRKTFNRNNQRPRSSKTKPVEKNRRVCQQSEAGKPAFRLMKHPSIFGSSQKRGVLIPICSRFESVTFRESEAILTLPEVCQQSEGR
ncbi:hypothetical protein B3286c2_0500 [Brucella vulpis]|nr:hypothetical protein B3286c2_0500 [Brucella vulpis]